MEYEGQICRAPMERSAYKLPVMVGCVYNHCRFCNLFRHLKFRLIPIEEVEADLKRVYDTGGSPRKIFLGDGSAFALDTDYLIHILVKHFQIYARHFFRSFRHISISRYRNMIICESFLVLKPARVIFMLHISPQVNDRPDIILSEPPNFIIGDIPRDIAPDKTHIPGRQCTCIQSRFK